MYDMIVLPSPPLPINPVHMRTSLHLSSPVYNERRRNHDKERQVEHVDGARNVNPSHEHGDDLGRLIQSSLRHSGGIELIFCRYGVSEQVESLCGFVEIGDGARCVHRQGVGGRVAGLLREFFRSTVNNVFVD